MPDICEFNNCMFELVLHNHHRPYQHHHNQHHHLFSP
jgi:hypothetical protein